MTVWAGWPVGRAPTIEDGLLLHLSLEHDWSLLRIYKSWEKHPDYQRIQREAADKEKRLEEIRKEVGSWV